MNANVLFLRTQAVALRFLRRIFPRSVKRYLKRFWDPNQVISAPEATFLGPRVDERRYLTAGEQVRTNRGETRPAKYDVICFSIIDWDFRWQRPQQVMSQFARQGHRIFYISTTRFPRGRRAPYAIQSLRENVWEVQLASTRWVDPYAGSLAGNVVSSIMHDVRALRADFDINCAVSVVQVATWAPAAYAAREEFGWRIVYDCMDEWDNFPGMHPDLLVEEQRLLVATDLLVVSGQQLWDKYAPLNANTVLARNAADFEHFHNPKRNELLSAIEGPIVGYFGAIAEWFDLDLMKKLAAERSDITFVLLGGVFGVAVEELQGMSNVRLLGQKPYELMPAYLRHFDACIIPFKVNAITEATDPVKFYEYISQGKPVVAPRMPELYPYEDLLYIATDDDDFVRKVDLAIEESDPGIVERRIEMARQNTWTERVTRIKDGIRRTHPGISVVIVTFNNLEYTQLCLDSVYRNTLWPNFEVIVVDNASDDGTPAYLKDMERTHENVKVILNSENHGFARANNQGLSVANGDYLVLLNNDTVVPNGWLSKLVRHLPKPEIGLVNSVTNFSGNESKVPVTYIDLSAMEQFAENYTRQREGQFFDIRVAAMYCVAMRRDVFTAVGMLDEQFGMGMFEDDDYSHRVRLAGHRVVCVEDAFVHHFGQASFKKLSQTEYQQIWDRNQKYYEEKWATTWEAHQHRG
ncbi:MAG: glycosyltransferase [Acidobacteriota bacterium]